jgi:hypothetical protein
MLVGEVMEAEVVEAVAEVTEAVAISEVVTLVAGT